MEVLMRGATESKRAITPTLIAPLAVPKSKIRKSKIHITSISPTPKHYRGGSYARYYQSTNPCQPIWITLCSLQPCEGILNYYQTLTIGISSLTWSESIRSFGAPLVEHHFVPVWIANYREAANRRFSDPHMNLYPFGFQPGDFRLKIIYFKCDAGSFGGGLPAFAVTPQAQGRIPNRIFHPEAAGRLHRRLEPQQALVERTSTFDVGYWRPRECDFGNHSCASQIGRSRPASSLLSRRMPIPESLFRNATAVK
jgi:hypothetical protein